jgi:hypothetical protein
MTRALMSFILVLAATSAGATTWPWQAPADGQAPEYCKGLVVGGLGSHQVSGMSRTDLWLAWNYVIRSGALDQTAAASEFQAGLAQFQNAPDAASAASILQQADGSCGLGRTGHQITGW